MGIYFDVNHKIFHLQAKSTSYVIQIFKGKYPVHLYWGKKIIGNNFGYLLRLLDRPFSPNPDPDDLSFSLDTIPLEYPCYGRSDYRSPAFVIQHENGSTISDITYNSHRIYKGKPTLKGLPSTYVEKEDEAETLEIDFIDELTGLKITLIYTVFENFDAISRSVTFVNEGKEELKLQRALSFSLDFHDSDYEMLQLSGAWARERHIVKRKLAPGIQSVESRTGSSSHIHNPFIALLRNGAGEEYGEVYGFSLIYSGNFLAGAEVNQYDYTRVFMGINPFDFTWLLTPGESFQTPETVLVYSSNGLGEMSRTYHKLYRTRLCRGKYRDRIRPVLVNNWEATLFDIDAETLESFAKAGKELGLELLVLDDGWFGKRDDDTSSLGDWFVNSRKLPKGLKDIAEKINNIGLKFGLWFEPEMISPDSDLYRQHPDWCIHVMDRTRSQGRFQYILDLSRDEVCNAVIKMVYDVLSSAPISYVKWDYNRYMTEIGSAGLPSERQRETAHRFILGTYKIMDTLTTKFPDVLFESCSGGGGRFDPGILYYMPQTWTSDNTDAMERLKIQYGTSLVYPAITMGAHISDVPNHQVARVTPLITRGNVAMSGNFGYELDIRKFSDEEKEIVKAQVKQYKEIREIVQFGDFYRLKSPFEGNEAAWMFVSEDKTKAFIAYFKVLARPNEKFYRIFPKGLNPGYEYEIVNLNEKFGGDMIMNAGLNVPILNGDFQSFTWILKAV